MQKPSLNISHMICVQYLYYHRLCFLSIFTYVLLHCEKILYFFANCAIIDMHLFESQKLRGSPQKKETTLSARWVVLILFIFVLPNFLLVLLVTTLRHPQKLFPILNKR